MDDLERAEALLTTIVDAFKDLNAIDSLRIAAPIRMAQRIADAALAQVGDKPNPATGIRESEKATSAATTSGGTAKASGDEERAASQTLIPLETWNRIEPGQIAVAIDDFLIATGLAKSRREVGRFAQQGAKLTLVTKNSTFPQMTLRFGKTFALWPGEEIMLGRNATKIRAVDESHAKAQDATEEKRRTPGCDEPSDAPQETGETMPEEKPA